jgi:DNA-binding MarR family transcriptional regulator
VRWINMLIGMGLFHSAPHPTDRRLALLSMSEQAREGMRQWLGGLRPLLDRVEVVRATPRG